MNSELSIWSGCCAPGIRISRRRTSKGRVEDDVPFVIAMILFIVFPTSRCFLILLLLVLSSRPLLPPFDN